ncbi:MAG: hypothetical protein R3E01_36715 [Pirellulaceae bacterium]
MKSPRPFTIVCVILLTVAGCFGPPSEIRSVKKYKSCRKSFPPQLVARFPTDTPEDKSDPVFSYYPGFLQGGAHIQLRVRLSPETIVNLVDELKTQTKHAYKGGGFFTHYNEDQEHNLPTASYHTQRDDVDANEFPGHFTLYVLDADDRASGSWNHGSTFGIAISEETNEAIYWAENW